MRIRTCEDCGKTFEVFDWRQDDKKFLCRRCGRKRDFMEKARRYQEQVRKINEGVSDEEGRVQYSNENFGQDCARRISGAPFLR